MGMVQRITWGRRLSYNTKSNKRKVVRTPGGKLVFQYLKKRPSVPKCPMTGQAEGCDSRHQPGEGSHVQEAEDRLQGLRWSAEPQSREREDCEGFPHRGEEDRHEGAQGPGEELTCRTRCDSSQ